MGGLPSRVLALVAVAASACSASESQAVPPPAAASAPTPVEQFTRPMTMPTPAEDLLVPSLTQTAAAARVIELVTDVRARMVTTRYSHHTRVRPKEGSYAWDCSGMAGWMLYRAARSVRDAFSQIVPTVLGMRMSSPGAEAATASRRLPGPELETDVTVWVAAAAELVSRRAKHRTTETRVMSRSMGTRCIEHHLSRI